MDSMVQFFLLAGKGGGGIYQLLFQEDLWSNFYALQRLLNYYFQHQCLWSPQLIVPFDQDLHFHHSCTNSPFPLTLREFPDVGSAIIKLCTKTCNLPCRDTAG
jgi:hypothetical protein